MKSVVYLHELNESLSEKHLILYFKENFSDDLNFIIVDKKNWNSHTWSEINRINSSVFRRCKKCGYNDWLEFDTVSCDEVIMQKVLGYDDMY